MIENELLKSSTELNTISRIVWDTIFLGLTFHIDLTIVPENCNIRIIFIDSWIFWIFKPQTILYSQILLGVPASLLVGLKW